MPKVMMSPANASTISPVGSAASWTPLITALVEASTDSPSTMRVNRPYRSAMCPGCQGIRRPPRTANAGKATSNATSTTKAT